MRWLANFGTDSPAFDRLWERLLVPQSVDMEQQPSIATTTANFTTLHEELHMTASQVRSAPVSMWCWNATLVPKQWVYSRCRVPARQRLCQQDGAG